MEVCRFEGTQGSEISQDAMVINASNESQTANMVTYAHWAQPATQPRDAPTIVIVISEAQKAINVCCTCTRLYHYTQPYCSEFCTNTHATYIEMFGRVSRAQ